MKFLKSEKGEFTVEATIVVTITFIILVFFLFIGIVMYQHVHLQSATDRIASRGAMMYATRSTDMNTGYRSLDSFWDSDPYRYIFDGTYKSNAEGVIESKLKEAVGEENVMVKRATTKTPDATVELGIFTRKVVVTGSRKFDVPFASVFSLGSSMFDLDVTSTAYIMDMPETIRNIDYATDILKRNKKVTEAIGKVSELKGKLQDFINKLGEK